MMSRQRESHRSKLCALECVSPEHSHLVLYSGGDKQWACHCTHRIPQTGSM